MLVRLGDLLRLTLDEGTEGEICLRVELERLDLYLDLQQMRFGPRLVLVRDIAPEALQAQVPAMLLQPLIENALTHGIGPKPGPGEIRMPRGWWMAVCGSPFRIRVGASHRTCGRARDLETPAPGSPPCSPETIASSWNRATIVKAQWSRSRFRFGWRRTMPSSTAEPSRATTVPREQPPSRVRSHDARADAHRRRGRRAPGPAPSALDARRPCRCRSSWANARNADSCVRMIRELKPELVFLDIQMPGADGFQVLDRAQVTPRPFIIFATAFAKHAVRAFDTDAVDYLLKPYDDKRLSRALERARTALAAREGSRSRYLERLAATIGKRTVFIQTDEIDWIEASGNYVSLHTRGQQFLLRISMTALETQLDPATFVRVHRSAIVRIDGVRNAGDRRWRVQDCTVRRFGGAGQRAI